MGIYINKVNLNYKFRQVPVCRQHLLHAYQLKIATDLHPEIPYFRTSQI